MNLENMMGLIHFNDKIWIYSSKIIQELSFENEDREVWKLFLENKKYEEAYEICKKYPSKNLDYVNFFSNKF